MILSSYAGLWDEATSNDIPVCDRTAVYPTGNKSVFRELTHIFSRSALWVHSKYAVKTRGRWIMYKRIYNHLFGRNVLGNRNAACETMIGRLKYHGEKKTFNWEKYMDLYVEQHNVKATLTAQGFHDWSETNFVDTCLVNISGS